MEFKFYNPGKIEDKNIEEITISVRVATKWLFIRSEVGSWDLLSGKVLHNENIAESAERILNSVSGFCVEELRPVCPYTISGDSLVCGYLYFASGRITSDFSYDLFDKLPDLLNRGIATRRLFTGTQGWLNMQSNADELWDVYDENRNLTGRLHRRGDFLEEGDYHLVVHIWLLNSKGEFLLTKRAPNKGFPNTWETPGGAAQAGDDSLKAALREVHEETGLKALPENAELLFEFRREDDFCDVWLIRQDFSLEDVVLLEGETIDKTYADSKELLFMYENKMLVPYSYIEDLLNKISE